MYGFLGGGFAACQPPSKDNNEQGAEDFYADFNRSGLDAELTFDKHVRNQHAARDPAQQRRAEGHHQRVAVDQLQDQRAAPDDDGHADDQAEDHQADLVIRVRALRGAGERGLGGMRALRSFGAGWLWRPLLGLPREALADYARGHGLAWVEDPSNASPHADRNFLRLQVLPALSARWPGAGAALGALRRHVAELEEAARKAVVIEGFQARLRQAAGASFEPARAEFFLNNRRPELGMATPLAYCVDERSLREAMSLLGSRSKR